MTDKLPVLPLSDEKLIRYYRMGYRSRQASIIGRREVLTGKAKFGIFGGWQRADPTRDRRAFPPRRLALGLLSRPDLDAGAQPAHARAVFAQLYAHADPDFDLIRVVAT